MQDVLGTGPLQTGLAFLPLAIALAAGVHLGSHVMTHAGVRAPMAAGFATAASGLLLLSAVDAGGSYLTDLLPGMLLAGVGLGVVLVSVSVSVMTGAADDETGILSGPQHDRTRDRRVDRHRSRGHHRRRLEPA